MKQLLIAIAMVLSLSMNADAAAQKHRHTPRTEQVDSTKNNQNAIEAFSDTTATADDAEDEYSYRSGTTYSKGDVEEAKEIIDSLGHDRWHRCHHRHLPARSAAHHLPDILFCQ